MNTIKFSTCILKIASRCNIACKYCYIYELADQSWKTQPKVMSLKVIKMFLEKLETYIVENDITSFDIVIHGGEPLLAGIDTIHQLLEMTAEVSKRLSKDITTTIQTNGILLSDEWIYLFKKFNVKIGISHDGPSFIHDKNRIDHKGNGTEKIVSAKILELQQKAPELFIGVLTVIDPSANGSEVIDYFYNLKIPKIDLLLPDQNYLLTPKQYPSARIDSKLYTSFLSDAYKRWRQIDDPNFDIRLFRELVLAVMGKSPSLDSLGVADVGIFVIESDGGIEPIDTFKCCGEEFTKLNLNIQNNSLEDLSKNLLMESVVKKSTSLSQTCSDCDYLSMCGGGYMPHRFNGIDFLNPSVYCETLFELCNLIDTDISNILSQANASLTHE